MDNNTQKKRNAKIFISLIFLFVLVSASHACSLSCDKCLVGDCECTSDCQRGVVPIYINGCSGMPRYELSVIGGIVKWAPSSKGTYYSKLLCDDGRKSECEVITVPTSQKTSVTQEDDIETYLPFLFVLTIVLLLLYAVYNYFNK